MPGFERRLPAWLPALLIGAVLAAGTWLRFEHLDQKLVWHDEIATRIFAAGYTTDDWKAEIYTGRVLPVADVTRYQLPNPERSAWQAIDGLARHDPQHPPLYYVLARLWVGLLGEGIGTLRALSAGLSLLGLPMMWWLARELSDSTRVAWNSVLLWSLSPFLVLYAQEAREYALWTVLIVAASAALVRAMRLTEAGDGRARVGLAWTVYVVAIVLGLYTSFSTTGLMLAHTLYVIARERGRVTPVSLSSAVALAIAVVLFMPWGMNLARHFEAFRASMKWSTEIVIPRFDLARIFMLNMSRTLVDLWPDLDTLGALVVDGLAVALIGACLWRMMRGVRRESSLLVVALIAAPLLMLLLPDLMWGGIRSVSGRYLTVAWVGVLMATALGLGTMARSTGTALLAFVLSAALISDLSNARLDAPWTKGVSIGLPEIARLIDSSASPLVVANVEVHHPGNMLALANLLPADASVQLLTIELEKGYTLPEHAGDVYLFSPNIVFREALEAQGHVHLRRLYEDVFVDLWKVEPAAVVVARP